MRRQSHEEILPKGLQLTVKHGRGGLMVWGCMSYQGLGYLHRIMGNVKCNCYWISLESCMLPSAKHLYPTGNYTFTQDNAPVHTSVSNKKFLQVSGVKVLLWPGQSPDLNPIENLWSYMKHQVARKRFSNTPDELFLKA